MYLHLSSPHVVDDGAMAEQTVCESHRATLFTFDRYVYVRCRDVTIM